MPWFKIDDSSYSHPKFVRAGNAALGLWMRCGAYSAQHLLEGQVPGAIAKAFGTPAQARKLVEAGLWHAAGHGCPRCPQPADGDFLIHDFFEGGRNSTRAQVESSRKAAADRQAKARAKAAARAAQDASDEETQRNSRSNGAPFDDELNANGAQFGPHFSGSAAGQDGSSQRDGLNGVTPSHAMPSHNKQASTGGGVPIPDWARPLLTALSSKGMDISWGRMSVLQWIAVQDLMKSHGIPYLVHLASLRWNPQSPIRFGSLMLQIWSEYPVPEPGSKWSAPDAPRAAAAGPLPPHCGDIDCHEDTRFRDVVIDSLPELAPCHICHPSMQGAHA